MLAVAKGSARCADKLSRQQAEFNALSHQIETVAIDDFTED